MLCSRYGIDNSHRTLHGALLDAEILADVYLLMTGGQTSLALSAGSEESDVGTESAIRRLVSGRKSLKIIRASADEIQAHESRLDLIEKKKVTSRCGVNRGAMRRLLFLVMLIPVLSWAKDSTAMSWLDNRFRVDPTVEQVSFVVKREDKSRSIVLVRLMERNITRGAIQTM